MSSQIRVKLGKFLASAAFVAGCALVAPAAQATDVVKSSVAVAPKAVSIVKQTGAGARVAFSDKMRMYSQRMAGSACTLAAGVAPEESKGYLAVASREFNRILKALEHGDAALGIVGAEENGRTLEALTEVKQDWVPMDAIVQTILRDGPNEKLLRELTSRNGALMDHSAIVVSVVSNQYSDPTSLILSDAIRLQIAGRQRMLTQKLILDACLLQEGETSTSERLLFKETIDLFDISLAALQRGMPEAGVYPTQDDKILSGLAKVESEWRNLQWPLRAVIAGASWDAETRANVYTGLNMLMHEMDKVVVAYTSAAKLNL